MPNVGRGAPGGRRVGVWWAALGLIAVVGCAVPDPLAGRDETSEIPDVPPEEDSTWSSTSYDASSDPVPVVIPSEPVTQGERIHVVQKGDTLYAIARAYYSDESKWRLILESNRDVISHPDRVFVGQELRIP